MATSGESAWKKYYQGKGDVKTIVKVDSETYEVANPTKKLGTVKARTEVVVLKATKYDSKILVQLPNNNLARIKFDNLVKPNVKASAAVSLKPQAFGVASDSKKFSLKEYTKTVMDHIKDRKDLTPEIKLYLEALTDYYAGGKTTKETVKKTYTKFKDSIPISDINKDYGEVLGPIACIKKSLLTEKKIKLSSSARIYIPIRPNEPLMDYAIIEGNKQYTISAKSGTTTNVVKPKDILDLIGKRKATKDKWKIRQEYKILEILKDRSIISGPIAVLAQLNMYGLTKEAADEADSLGDRYDIHKFAGFISQNEYLSKQKKPTINEIMYEAEKIVSKMSKNELDFSSIFKDAIKNEVIYVKYELDSTVGTWEIITDENITAKSVYLRSKNGYTRKSDRMGIQV